MNTTKKTLIYGLCAVALVSASVMGTLAYLTDRDSVANTFTVGDVQIELDEAKVNLDGTLVAGADRVSENQYHLIPGQTYTKDPTVTVLKGSEESYVRMEVTLNNYNALKEIFGVNFLPQNYVEGWDANVWVPYGEAVVADDTVTYEFRYANKVNAVNATGDLVLDALFDTFTLPGEEVDGTDLKKLVDFKITVEGHAIQAATFEDANAAWAAFDKQMGLK